jgi:DNA-binding NtrC family response regulator
MLRASASARIVGDSASMVALRAAVAAVARTRASVLVTGETGTGKGLVAASVHELSGARRFVHVDCASLSPTVIESELFGHERGAFTGAGERRIGRLEQAATGTLFLDEIADVHPGLQAKLLRVLQDRRFERVGGSETLGFDARVVAATNRDLAREIADGRFRADLYYRLQVVELHVPPLRARRDDIPHLVRAFGAACGARVEFEKGFFERLAAHEWPGNVRELSNLVERLVVTRPHGPWRADDAIVAKPLTRASDRASSKARFEARERSALEEILSANGWNVSAAARSLGVSRGALRGRMTRLGLG